MAETRESRNERAGRKRGIIINIKIKKIVFIKNSILYCLLKSNDNLYFLINFFYDIRLMKRIYLLIFIPHSAQKIPYVDFCMNKII
jgi:hypothetical protein